MPCSASLRATPRSYAGFACPSRAASPSSRTPDACRRPTADTSCDTEPPSSKSLTSATTVRRGSRTCCSAYRTARAMSVPPPSCAVSSTVTGSCARCDMSTTAVSNRTRRTVIPGSPARMPALTAL
ncbi:Uncharacterised protein [Mycobacteroides abscessus]|nr:Uncharacterised protein [Mycobacteroides abscessus]